MEWMLLLLLSLYFGFVLGYIFRSTQDAADAHERERDFLDLVMKEVQNHTPNEAARAGEVIAKKMADDVLRRYQ